MLLAEEFQRKYSISSRKTDDQAAISKGVVMKELMYCNHGLQCTKAAKWVMKNAVMKGSGLIETSQGSLTFT